MEPQSFVCGNYERHDDCVNIHVASMEPQSFVCGNQNLPVHARNAITLQWSHSLSSVVTVDWVHHILGS